MDDLVVGTAFGQRIQIGPSLLVVGQGPVEMSCVRLVVQKRQQSGNRVLHRPDQAEIERAAITESSGVGVDLRDFRALGEKLPIREIRAQHQQRIAALHGQ